MKANLQKIVLPRASSGSVCVNTKDHFDRILKHWLCSNVVGVKLNYEGCANGADNL